MRYWVIRVMFASCLLVWPSVGHAALMLSISSSDNLSDLRVGEEFLIQVTLSGVTTEVLDTLAVDIAIDEAVFGEPSTPMAGVIIPSPQDNFNPFSFADTDLVTGAFLLNTGLAGVDTNGVFFSFKMLIDGVGSGAIGFVPGSALAATSTNDLLEVIEGRAIPYSAIPEPTTISFLGFTMIGWLRQGRNVRSHS